MRRMRQIRTTKRSGSARLGSVPELSMTPLIDVALTLLVVFIIASPLIHNSIRVNLPSSQVDETDKQNQQSSSVITLDATGKLYLEDKLISKKKLLEKVVVWAQWSTQPTIFIHADTAVNYGLVIELVAEIKKQGLTHVALATKQESIA